MLFPPNHTTLIIMVFFLYILYDFLNLSFRDVLVKSSTVYSTLVRKLYPSRPPVLLLQSEPPFQSNYPAMGSIGGSAGEMGTLPPSIIPQTHSRTQPNLL